MKSFGWRYLALASLLVAAQPACRSSGDAADDHGHGDDVGTDETVRGPHGGRMLRDGDFAVELAIYERGVPPEYRAWCFDDETPLDPESCTLSVELTRFEGEKQVFRFTKRADYLVGDRTVEEPHSFLVAVRARADGEEHEWQYESFEGRTSISPETAESAGIHVETAGPATIRDRLRTFGRIVPNAEAFVRIVPRYPGTLREVRKRVGDVVAEKELLAIVEASQTLQTYEIRSPLAGTVLSRDAAPGEVVDGRAIYTVADLRTVWVELLLKPADAARVRRDQPVELAGGQGLRAKSTIEYLAPTAASEGQGVVARAVLENRDANWRPGLFVTADILINEVEVPIAVRSSALQTFRDWDVVFLNGGDVYQAMPIEVGRRDADHVEILDGVKAGQRYAAGGSFVVKADIEKSGASHDH